MRAYHIVQETTKTDFYTTDFMDLWAEVEATTETVKITAVDVTVSEFNELVKNNVNGSEIIG